MLQLTCLSHQCLLWGDTKHGEGRHLEDGDIEALAAVHQLAHSIRATTIADLFGEPENDE
ncbi:hypothetical protein [Nocardia africana]